MKMLEHRLEAINVILSKPKKDILVFEVPRSDTPLLFKESIKRSLHGRKVFCTYATIPPDEKSGGSVVVVLPKTLTSSGIMVQ